MRFFLSFSFVIISSCFAIAQTVGFVPVLSQSSNVFLESNFENTVNTSSYLGILNCRRVAFTSRYHYFLIPSFDLGYYGADSLQAISLQVSDYGVSDYHITTLSSSYAKKLHDKLVLGLNLRYGFLQRAEVGSKSLLLPEFGLVYSMSEFFKTTISYSRQFYGGEGRNDLFQFGANYRENDFILALGAVCYEGEWFYKFGIEYRVVDAFGFRLMYNDYNTALSGTVIYEKSNFTFDVGYSYQMILGASPSASLVYQL